MCTEFDCDIHKKYTAAVYFAEEPQGNGSSYQR
jgi:hypothetical protein